MWIRIRRTDSEIMNPDTTQKIQFFLNHFLYKKYKTQNYDISLLFRSLLFKCLKQKSYILVILVNFYLNLPQFISLFMKRIRIRILPNDTDPLIHNTVHKGQQILSWMSDIKVIPPFSFERSSWSSDWYDLKNYPEQCCKMYIIITAIHL